MTMKAPGRVYAIHVDRLTLLCDVRDERGQPLFVSYEVSGGAPPPAPGDRVVFRGGPERLQKGIFLAKGYSYSLDHADVDVLGTLVYRPMMVFQRVAMSGETEQHVYVGEPLALAS